MSDTPVPRDHDRSGAGADSRWFPTLDSRTFDVDGVSIFARYGGAPDRPALLLVHGYPESHVMWHQVANGSKSTTSWSFRTCAATETPPNPLAYRITATTANEPWPTTS